MSKSDNTTVAAFVFDAGFGEERAADFLKSAGFDDAGLVKSGTGLIARVRETGDATEKLPIEGHEGVSALVPSMKSGSGGRVRIMKMSDEKMSDEKMDDKMPDEKPAPPVEAEEHEVEGESNGGEGPYSRRVMTALHGKMTGLADEFDAAAVDLEHPDHVEWGTAMSETLRTAIKMTEEMHDNAHGENYEKMGTEDAPPEEGEMGETKMGDYEEKPEEESTEEEMEKKKSAKLARLKSLQDSFFTTKIPMSLAKSIGDATAKLIEHGEDELATRLVSAAVMKSAPKPKPVVRTSAQIVAEMKRNTELQKIDAQIKSYKSNGSLQGVIEEYEQRPDAKPHILERMKAAL